MHDLGQRVAVSNDLQKPQGARGREFTGRLGDLISGTYVTKYTPSGIVLASKRRIVVVSSRSP